MSPYSPQQDEQSAEMLTRDDRQLVAEQLPGLRAFYPNPAACVFSKMSGNYSADRKTRVVPCIFGATPDCSQCGCAVTRGLHQVEQRKNFGPLGIGYGVRTQ